MAETRTAAVAGAMTVDVEDYFQVAAFDGCVQRQDWETYPCRVERNMDRILTLFDDCDVSATFFCLGWVAERYPQVIRRIVGAGHELASHGYEHIKVHSQPPAEFRADVRKTKQILEEIGGQRVGGYRAASFSIDERSLWAFDILAEEGYAYSSSVYPIKHDHYGMPDASRFAYKPSDKHDLLEIPISTVSLFNRNLPGGGGGYFRLLPYGYTRWAQRRMREKDGKPTIFYFHPWEVDPDQPRFEQAPLRSRFRHYINLGRMESRLRTLLQDFRWDRMDRIFLSSEFDDRCQATLPTDCKSTALSREAILPGTVS